LDIILFPAGSYEAWPTIGPWNVDKLFGEGWQEVGGRSGDNCLGFRNLELITGIL